MIHTHHASNIGDEFESAASKN